MEGKKVSESSVTHSHVMMPLDANQAGNVHGGLIMKHIDTTAGVVACRHARKNVVTASLDRIDFFHPVYVGDLLTLKASLNFVGKTSMEIGVRVEAENLLKGKTLHTASAFLTFVALDENGLPTAVPPLILLSDEEKRRNKAAKERKEMRLALKRKE